MSVLVLYLLLNHYHLVETGPKAAMVDHLWSHNKDNYLDDNSNSGSEGKSKNDLGRCPLLSGLNASESKGISSDTDSHSSRDCTDHGTLFSLSAPAFSSWSGRAQNLITSNPTHKGLSPLTAISLVTESSSERLTLSPS